MGSKNIGDLLITDATTRAIQSAKGVGASVSVVFRADDWSVVRAKVLRSDAVVFACLAIRPRMHQAEYPYLEDLIRTGIPFGVLSAGTSLDECKGVPPSLFNGFSDKTLEVLSHVDEKSRFASTRGVLTQQFCKANGLRNFHLSGDVAFFDCRYDDAGFVAAKRVDRIVVSDPHVFDAHAEQFSRLLTGLQGLFPQADMVVAQHGESRSLEGFCRARKLRLAKVFSEGIAGLSLYDTADLHVGFRVHGHVAALTRRKYSYLLEQDGRGADYGLTISRKISVPCYRATREGAPDFLQRVSNRVHLRKQPQIAGGMLPVDHMLSLIAGDYANGFNKFIGLESQIRSFSCAVLDDLRGLP